MHGLSLLQSVAVAMLILANAFFVAAEFALVSIRDTRIEQMLAASVPGARAVRRLQRGLDDLLPAVQLGVTLCSLALGWLGEPLAASVLAGWFGGSAARQHVYAPRRRRGARLCPHHLLPCRGRRTGAQVAGAAPGRGSGRGRRPAHAGLHGPRPPRRPPAQGFGRAVLRGFDVPLTERAAVHSSDELKLIATAARRMGLLPKFQETLDPPRSGTR